MAHKKSSTGDMPRLSITNVGIVSSCSTWITNCWYLASEHKINPQAQIPRSVAPNDAAHPPSDIDAGSENQFSVVEGVQAM